MAYPKQLLRLRPTRGLALDTPSSEVGPEFYTAGENVLFRNGFAERAPGARSAYATAISNAGVTDINHILNCEFSGTNYWLVADTDEVFSLEGNNGVDRTPSGGLTAVTAAHQWSSTLLNGVPVLSNGADEPLFWDGSGDLATLTGWAATESCKYITAFKFHLFALDMSESGGDFPAKLKWSDAAQPGTIPDEWTPSASNEAGDVELSDSPGAVLCAVPNRDTLLIYKRTAIYGCQYVGGNQKFAFAKLNSSTGAISRHAVCDLGNGQHFVVSQGDIVLTDGTNIQSVGQSRVKDYLFTSLDEDNYEALFCVFDRAKGEVIVAFPESGSSEATSALVYNVNTDSMGLRSLPDVKHAAVGIVNDSAPSNNWSSQSQTWANAAGPWAGSSTGVATESLVFGYGDTLQQQDTNDAISRNASVGKYDITFDNPERVKFVKRLHVRTKEGSGTLLVRVGARMSPTDTITWSTEVPLESPDQIVNCFAQGRYISVEVRSTGSDVWTITGIDLEAEVRGYH